MGVFQPHDAIGWGVSTLEFLGVVAGGISGFPPARHGLCRLDGRKGELFVFHQCQQTSKAFRQRGFAPIAWLRGREGKQPKQGFRAQRSVLQHFKVDAAVIAIQRLHRRAGQRRERGGGLFPKKLQSCRFIRQEMPTAKRTLVQGL